MIFCTGLGAVDSPPANGAASLDKLRAATTTPTVLIGDKPANVVFAGLSPQFVGVNQINVAIPPGTPTGDAVSLQISLGGVTTSASRLRSRSAISRVQAIISLMTSPRTSVRRSLRPRYM